jgi:iron complex outermembrane recepter protein
MVVKNVSIKPTSSLHHAIGQSTITAVTLGVGMLAMAASSLLIAQTPTTGSDIEEVIVTGSYIRNSAFAQNSPVDTVSQADLYESGSPSMANFIRDLPYTQNTNVVNNILADASGSQTSTNTTFNLRGLGENSTLTMVDGIRSINNSITAMIPDIAINRMEVVLDGGSALYGSDAVAGVVNLIPIKDFEGIRTRTYHQRPFEGGMDEFNAAILLGAKFSNGVNWVGAYDYRRRTRLSQYERPREWMMDDGSSTSGFPGSFRRVNNATINPGGLHGGVQAGSVLLDPSCGTFNQGLEDRTQKYNTPSGIPIGTNCQYNYTTTYLYSRGMEEHNLYQNVTWEATDWLQFEITGNWNYLEDEGNRGVVTALNANNRAALVVPASHPANPYGYDVIPFNWRPSTGLGTQPHWINDIGETFGNSDDSSNRVKLGARFDINPNWSGYAYISRQERKNMTRNPRARLSLPRLQLALAGKGGELGNLYFNPFGSADARSPFHVPGVTDNSQEIMEWMWVNTGAAETTGRDYLDLAEVTVSGELMELPTGTLAMATGLQRRKVEERNFANPLSAIGQNYNTDITSPPPKDTQYFSETQAAFVEVEVPVWHNVAMQIAVRHERFTDFNLESTTPKVALRWEAMPSLSLRASWGESFLAPTPTQARPFIPNESCGELFSGNDPFRAASMIGASTCTSGNPNLKPETSTIWNVGLTWEPVNDLSFSVDYQEVEYVDRIRTLNNVDTVNAQFDRFLSVSGFTRENYSATPGTASRNAADAFMRSIAGPSNAVQRNPDTLAVERIFRQAANISSVWIDLVDAKVSYRIPTDDWGTFRVSFNGSYNLTYKYADLNGVVVDALGKQNARTGVVAPVPKLKASARTSWFRDKHSASLAANYRHHVLFDDFIIDRYGDGWANSVDSHIDRETIINAQYAYELDRFFDSNFTISAGINNLFNRRPERLPIQGGFESRLSVPWGRQVWVSIDWTPGS